MKKLALCALLFSSLAFAEERRTLGVFLPASLADAQERFALAEGLAETLSASLNVKVAGKNFGKYEDFAKAVSSGQLDYALTDGFIAAQLPAKGSLIALAQKPGPAASGRWVLVSKSTGPVKALTGKRIAIPKGAAGQDLKFLANVVFAGDFDAKKNLKMVAVPNVESALQSLDVKTAEAALVPAEQVRKGEKPIYRSARVVGVVVLSLKGDADAAQATFTATKAPAPFEKFVQRSGIDLLKRAFAAQRSASVEINPSSESCRGHCSGW